MFDTETKEKAMLACGRRCCICHKFCGVKMECHHIKQAANGGEDTFANCIPLCFECHAEVGHYNAKHPKGIKFSATELQSHRDHWYQKIRNGEIYAAQPAHLELDQSLFRKAWNCLKGSSGMFHFKEHDYGNMYDRIVDERLHEFLRIADMPECEFFDVRMETAFADLRMSVRRYIHSKRNRIWWESDGMAGIPREWEDTQESRFDEAVEVMNKASSEVWEAFVAFVKEGRRTLQIDPEQTTSSSSGSALI